MHGLLNIRDLYGNLRLRGTINIISSGFETTTTPTQYSSDNANNGYTRTNTAYILVSTASKFAVNNTTWKIDGGEALANGTYTVADGKLTVFGTDWGTEYYLGGVDENYSSIGKTNGDGEALTTLVLAGKGLTVDGDMGNVGIRTEYVGTSYITIAANNSLAAGKIDGASGTKLIELKGAGTYTLAAGSAAMPTGVSLHDTWTGTVKVTNASVSDFDFDTLGQAGSWVQVVGVTGYLEKADTTDITYN
ncbi:MAG: hypothetical protein IJ948_03565, partial [Clostridia bacterium]|nr:hypothetical protein [Clostridia bacterium]